MVERNGYINEVLGLLEYNPVVALIGARQVGKTTLARLIAQHFEQTTIFDLENPEHLARLQDPMLVLPLLRGLVIIDEIQHSPELFKVLRVLADRPDHPAKFLVLGSASPHLLRQTSETLAGRIAYVAVHGFSLGEVGTAQLESLWLRGGFPKAFIAPSDEVSFSWRQDFIRTFLERDLPQLGINIPAITMRRFWMMVAHYHGQLWNSNEFARAFGLSDKTVKNYLDLLTSTFVIRQLPPWWENLSKRQVKAPKVYIHDTGILHALLGLKQLTDLSGHPKVGASWESFALNNIVAQLKATTEEAFFWRTQTGAELDLLVVRGNQRLGFECKRSVSPQMTKSLHIAGEDLHLTQLYIVHAGKETYPLASNITALSLHRLLQDLNPVT